MLCEWSFVFLFVISQRSRVFAISVKIHQTKETQMTTIILIAVGIAVLGLAVYFLRPVIQRKNYLRHFAEAYDNDIVIFDTETTGLNVLYDEIVQIAAVRVRDGQVVGEPLNIFLEKKRDIPRMLGDIPNPLIGVYEHCEKLPREKGLKMFLDFVGNSPVLGHYVQYDCQILKYNLRRDCGIYREKVFPVSFDTLIMSRILFPKMRSYNLGALNNALRLVSVNQSSKPLHLADNDVLVTKALAERCLMEYRH